jgi:hypothetical protein
MKLVLNLKGTCLATLCTNSQVISTQEIPRSTSMLELIYSTFGEFNITELVFLVKPNLQGEFKDYGIISEITLQGLRFWQVVSSEDFKSMEFLAKAFNINLIKVVTSLDLYTLLFKEDEVVLVDEYLEDNLLVTSLKYGEVISCDEVKSVDLKDHLEFSSNRGEIPVKLFQDNLEEVARTMFTNLESLDSMDLMIVGESLIAARSQVGSVLDISPDIKFITTPSKSTPADIPVLAIADILNSTKEEEILDEDSFGEMQIVLSREEEEKEEVPEIEISKGKFTKLLPRNIAPKELKDKDKDKAKPKSKAISSLETAEVESKLKRSLFQRRKKSDLDFNEIFPEKEEAGEELLLNLGIGLDESIHEDKRSMESYPNESKVALMTAVVFIVILLGMLTPKIIGKATIDVSDNVTKDYLTFTSANLSKYYKSPEGLLLGTYKDLQGVGGATLSDISFTNGHLQISVVAKSQQSFEQYKKSLEGKFSIISVEEVPLAKEDPVSSVRKSLLLK